MSDPLSLSRESQVVMRDIERHVVKYPALRQLAEMPPVVAGQPMIGPLATSAFINQVRHEVTEALAELRETVQEHLSCGHHTDTTLDKVRAGLRKHFKEVTPEYTDDIINALHNEGILFRERT